MIRQPVSRLSLATFSVPLGVVGLAGVWTQTSVLLGWPLVGADVLWIVAAIAFIATLVVYLTRAAQSTDRLTRQLRDPIEGPLTAIVPIVGMQLAGALGRTAELPGAVLYWISAGAALVFAAWLIGTWLEGSLDLEAMHGGYLIPTVAAGFVAAGVGGTLGVTGFAWAMFGVGVLFWLVLTTLVLLRLTFRPTLPDELIPSMTVLIAPPALAGLAWFTLTGEDASIGASILGGTGLLMLLVQIALLPRYARLRFSLSFWSFTFPAAATASDGIRWIGLSPTPLHAPLVLTVATAVSVLVAVIAGRSVALAVSARRHRDPEPAGAATLTDVPAPAGAATLTEVPAPTGAAPQRLGDGLL